MLVPFYLVLLVSCINDPDTLKKEMRNVDIYHKSLMWPLDGRITSYYGNRSSGFHHGIDIKAPYGQNIYSVAKGTVEFAGTLSGYGKTVILNHREYKTLYAHCSKLKVKRKQRVRRGQTIALVGSSGNSSGPHLHFEYRNTKDKALNPIAFLRSRKLY